MGRLLASRSTVGVVVLALGGLALSSCASTGGSASAATRRSSTTTASWVKSGFCDTYHRFLRATAQLDQVDGDTTDAQFRRVLSRYQPIAERYERAIHRGSTTTVDPRDDLDTYVDQFKKTWTAVGPAELQKKADERGEFSIASAIYNSLWLDIPNETALDRSATSARDGRDARCVRLPPVPTKAPPHGIAGGRIAAVPADGHTVESFTPAGRNTGALPLPVGLAVDPTVFGPITSIHGSPDGRHLAISAGRGGDQPTKLIRVDLAAGSLTTVSGLGNCWAWDPDNRDAWAFLQGTGLEVLAKIPPDGARVPDQTFDVTVPWCISARRPDGTFLAHADHDIRVLDGHGNSATTLVDLPGCSPDHAQESPDHRRVAFVALCGDRARSGLYVVDTDGRHVRQLTTQLVGDFSWAPTSDWIAFASYATGHVPAPGTDEATDTAIFAVSVDHPDHIGRVTDAGWITPAWLR